jgi:hypothetical protein
MSQVSEELMSHTHTHTQVSEELMYLHSETARQAQRQTDLEKSAGRVARERDFLQEMLTKAKKRQEADAKELAQLRLQVCVMRSVSWGLRLQVCVMSVSKSSPNFVSRSVSCIYICLRINIYMYIYMSCQRSYTPAVSRRALIEP